MLMVRMKTWEPSGMDERIVPMAHGFAMMENGGFSKVQLIDLNNNVIIFERVQR